MARLDPRQGSERAPQGRGERDGGAEGEGDVVAERAARRPRLAYEARVLCLCQKRFSALAGNHFECEGTGSETDHGGNLRLNPE